MKCVVIIKRISISFIVILLCISFAACSGSDSIVGAWDATVNGEIKTITYSDDGVYTVTKEDGAVEEEGRYEVEGDKLILSSANKIEGENSLNLQEASNDILTFNINGNTLTLISKDGDSIDLVRKR